MSKSWIYNCFVVTLTTFARSSAHTWAGFYFESFGNQIHRNFFTLPTFFSVTVSVRPHKSCNKFCWLCCKMKYIANAFSSYLHPWICFVWYIFDCHLAVFPFQNFHRRQSNIKLNYNVSHPFLCCLHECFCCTIAYWEPRADCKYFPSKSYAIKSNSRSANYFIALVYRTLAGQEEE